MRSDFAETLYWNPLLIAGADGKAPLSFDLSDSVTTFRLLADAHGAGRIGSGRADIISRIPFNLEPKLPLEVNAGDRIDLPLAVVNDSPSELDVALKLEHGDLVKLDGDAERKLKLPAGKRGREYFALDVTGQKGDCPIDHPRHGGQSVRCRHAKTENRAAGLPEKRLLLRPHRRPAGSHGPSARRSGCPARWKSP